MPKHKNPDYSLATFLHYERSKFARKIYMINLFNRFEILLSHPIQLHRAVPVVLWSLLGQASTSGRYLRRPHTGPV
jgi:hypothetical protein